MLGKTRTIVLRLFFVSVEDHAGLGTEFPKWESELLSTILFRSLLAACPVGGRRGWEVGADSALEDIA